MGSTAVKREEEDSNDYVEYDVYITPDIDPARLYLLQFPTRSRDRPYNSEFQETPTEFRMKPESGFVEMDVPIPPYWKLDEAKAQEWGQSMQRAEREGGAGFGLANGLTGSQGIGTRSRAGQRAEINTDTNSRLESLTLGGQIHKPARSDPYYMLGVFRDDELHLTPMANFIHIRPQFHHVDAKTFSDRVRARSATVAGAEANARAMEPRYVTMTRKSNPNDNEDQAAVSAKELLQKAHDEPWTRMSYADDLKDEAFAAYNEKLLIENPAETPILVSDMKDADYLDYAVPRVHAAAGKSRTLRGVVNISSDESDDVE